MKLKTLFFLCSAWTCYGQAIDVFYTGRPLGYFRYSDQQDFLMKGCPSDPKDLNDPGKALKKIWDERRNNASSARLLVGMGDNFAPEYFSRTFTGTPPERADVPYPAKDRYFWDGVSQKWVVDKTTGVDDVSIPTDNVACFLQLMGYTAVVPGKHDFYFGPNRLREIGRWLHDNGTAMLAGNLSIATTVPEARPRLPLHEVQHELEKHQRNPSGPAYTVMPLVEKSNPDEPPPAIKFPDVVLPYLRRFEIGRAHV